MADEVLRISDGESHLRITDPSQGTVIAPLVEIGSGGAFSSLARVFEANAYLDVTVVLQGQPPRQFFANVVSSGPTGLRVAWMHIDPGEQTRLRALVDAYRGQSSDAGTRTRRVLRPSTLGPAPGQTPPSAPATVETSRPAVSATPEFTPFSDAPVSGQGARVGTRRVLKPSTLTPAAKHDLVLDDSDTRDDSRLHQVVLAPTDRFVQMRDDREPEATSVAEVAPAGVFPAVKDAPAAASPSPSPEPERGTVMGQDGRMDIGATIRNKAKTVRASELAARHDKVRVLNMATIKALIMEAVEEAAGHLTRALNDADRKRLLEEAEESFQERLKAFQLEKAGADERANKLHEQLAQAQRLLEEERKRTISADQFTVSAAGMDEMEAKFKRMIERSASEGKISESLLDELRKAASHVLDEERQRIREKEMQAQNDKIALLEKKIGRLAGNLEDAERQRDEARHLAQALESSAGAGPVDVERIKNKFKTGLDKDDPRKAAKLAAMKELLEANRELRRQLGLPVGAPPAPTPAPVAAEPTPGPAPVVPAIVAPVVEIEATPVASDGDEPLIEIDPDNEPWTPDPVAEAPADDGNALVGGIKRIRAFAAKPPPALEPEAELSATDEEPAEPEANPDDEMWEAPAEAPAASADEDERGVKKITAYKNFAPPPLEPRSA